MAWSAVLLGLPCWASAQLSPDRMYYGVGRSMPMTVAVPKDAPGEVVLRLYGADGRVVKSAPAAAGSVNLATLFPELWSDDKPVLRYAQLAAGAREIGPPVVLQPMVGPKSVSLVSNSTQQAFWFDDAGKKPSIDAKDARIVYWAESPIVYAGVRAYVDERVVLDTSLGEMEFALRPDAAPNTAFNFLHLVKGGFYTDILFHRVVPVNKQGQPFVIQAGDPTGTGDGGPGYSIDLEPSTLPYDFGVIGIARDTDPNTNGSQFFVALGREGTARLDGKYTAFGRLVRGAEVVRAIAATPLKEGTDRPADPPVLKSARTVPGPTMGSRASENPAGDKADPK